jgi:hypothetical protein
MSWSFQVSPVPVDEFEEAIDAARSAAQSNIEASNADGADQADAAVAAAKHIVASGTVGGEGVKVAATLSGHGNPGHAPKAGWSNDSVSVNVYQAS